MELPDPFSGPVRIRKVKGIFSKWVSRTLVVSRKGRFIRLFKSDADASSNAGCLFTASIIGATACEVPGKGKKKAEYMWEFNSPKKFLLLSVASEDERKKWIHVLRSTTTVVRSSAPISVPAAEEGSDLLPSSLASLEGKSQAEVDAELIRIANMYKQSLGTTERSTVAIRGNGKPSRRLAPECHEAPTGHNRSRGNTALQAPRGPPRAAPRTMGEFGSTSVKLTRTYSQPFLRDSPPSSPTVHRSGSPNPKLELLSRIVAPSVSDCAEGHDSAGNPPPYLPSKGPGTSPLSRRKPLMSSLATSAPRGSAEQPSSSLAKSSVHVRRGSGDRCRTDDAPHPGRGGAGGRRVGRGVRGKGRGGTGRGRGMRARPTPPARPGRQTFSDKGSRSSNDLLCISGGEESIQEGHQRSGSADARNMVHSSAVQEEHETTATCPARPYPPSPLRPGLKPSLSDPPEGRTRSATSGAPPRPGVLGSPVVPERSARRERAIHRGHSRKGDDAIAIPRGRGRGSLGV